MQQQYNSKAATVANSNLCCFTDPSVGLCYQTRWQHCKHSKVVNRAKCTQKQKEKDTIFSIAYISIWCYKFPQFSLHFSFLHFSTQQLA